jgi:hypothetical protein
VWLSMVCSSEKILGFLAQLNLVNFNIV